MNETNLVTPTQLDEFVTGTAAAVFRPRTGVDALRFAELSSVTTP